MTLKIMIIGKICMDVASNANFINDIYFDEAEQTDEVFIQNIDSKLSYSKPHTMTIYLNRCTYMPNAFKFCYCSNISKVESRKVEQLVERR